MPNQYTDIINPENTSVADLIKLLEKAPQEAIIKVVSLDEGTGFIGELVIASESNSVILVEEV